MLTTNLAIIVPVTETDDRAAREAVWQQACAALSSYRPPKNWRNAARYGPERSYRVSSRSKKTVFSFMGVLFSFFL